MVDRKLFDLGVGHYRGRAQLWWLGYDRNQWIVYQSKKPLHFIAGNKNGIERVLREAGVEIAPRAAWRIRSFPELFLAWYADRVGNGADRIGTLADLLVSKQSIDPAHQ